MLRVSISGMASLALVVTTIVLAPLSVAAMRASNEITIQRSSIKWDDESNRSKLLESAPNWHDDVMQSLFDAYRHPEHYQLPSSSNAQQFNVQFINAFWGPLDNPFTKYPRPAKAFLMFDKTSYMAPLVKNLADGNYYVFDKSAATPTLLSDWVTNMRIRHGYDAVVRFNICNGYGDTPADSCATKNYQDEISDSTPSRLSARNNLASAIVQVPSARRGMLEDWKTKIRHDRRSELAGSNTIFTSSISWKNSASRNKLLSTVASWPNFNTIQANFEKIRDIRYFEDEQQQGFLRRISWLYPDDGCWTRATAAIKDLFGPFNNVVNNFQRPSKVFAFGNLCVNTTNSSEGSVSWWYHTAPVIRDAQTNKIYVLDPAVNSRKPLTIEDWVAEITSRSGACANGIGSIDTFNICNGYGSQPYSQCKEGYASESMNHDQMRYQNKERARQIELSRDADAVLGKQPPWIS